MSTQNERVLEHIEAHGSISALDGLRMTPPICAVHSRISELRAQGYDIETYRVPGYERPDGTRARGHWAYRFPEMTA